MERDRRAADAPREGRPSDVARDRLARRLRADVADVRVRLEEAVLRSDALLATGQHERAAAVLDEQQVLLAELRDTLSSSVAAAMVEADAETVLAGAPEGSTLFGAPVAEPPEPRRTARTTVSTLVSAVAALALLIVAAPTPPPDTLAASGRTDAWGLPDGPVPGSAGATADAVAEDDRPAVGPGELGDRQLTGSPEHAGAGDGDGRAIPASGLSHLQALVDQFVASVVRAAGSLAPATLPIIAQDVPAVRPGERVAEGTDPTPPRQPSEDDGPPPAEPTAEETTGPSADGPQPADDADERGPGLELPTADEHVSFTEATDVG